MSHGAYKANAAAMRARPAPNACGMAVGMAAPTKVDTATDVVWAGVDTAGALVVGAGVVTGAGAVVDDHTAHEDDTTGTVDGEGAELGSDEVQTAQDVCDVTTTGVVVETMTELLLHCSHPLVDEVTTTGVVVETTGVVDELHCSHPLVDEVTMTGVVVGMTGVVDELHCSQPLLDTGVVTTGVVVGTTGVVDGFHSDHEEAGVVGTGADEDHCPQDCAGALDH